MGEPSPLSGPPLWNFFPFPFLHVSRLLEDFDKEVLIFGTRIRVLELCEKIVEEDRT